MNNEDMSDMLQKLSSMINNSDNIKTENNHNDVSSNSDNNNFENLQNILSNMNLNYANNENENENNNTDNSNNNFSFDFETIIKIKKIMDSFNSAQNSPEANLLLSLKPYLNNNRKQKLDQYMQFLNLSKVIETFTNNGGVNNNDVSK